MRTRPPPFINFLLKRIKILGFSFFLVVATLVLFVSVYFYQVVRENYAGAQGEGFAFVSPDLQTNHDFNLLFLKVDDFGNPTSLVNALVVANFRVREKVVRVVEISPETELTNWLGDAKIKAASLLGQVFLNRNFDLGKTVSLGLGLPVDGVFYADEKGFAALLKAWGFGSGADIQESPEKLNFLLPLKAARSLLLLGRAYKTSLSPGSFLAFTKYLIFGGHQAYRFINPGPSLRYETWERIWRSSFTDSEVEAERLKVAVLNAADRQGLAAAGGRLVSNLGLDLIATDNLESEAKITYQDSVLLTRRQNYYSVERLARTFGVDDVRLIEDASTGEGRLNSFLWRTDILLILARDQLTLSWP